MEKNNTRSPVKLKNLKYEIKGEDSNVPLFEVLSAIVLGLVISVIIAIIIKFATEIDTLWQY